MWNRDRDNRYQKYQRRHDRPPIDFWRKIKKVINCEKEVGRFHLRFSMEISRPVFTDESEGFYQLSTMIKINNHYIRISPSVLIELMDILAEKEKQIFDAVDYVREENDKIRESQKETQEMAEARISSRRYQRRSRDEESHR